VVVVAFVPETVSAAGYFLPGRGVRPMGRGGAVAVDGLGLNALYYNPAGLVGLDGTRILIELAITDLETDFIRTPRVEPNGDVTVYPEVSNAKPPDVIPTFIATSDLGTDHLTLGFGLIAPWGVRYQYPEDGPQRYSAVSIADAASAMVAVGLGYEVEDWLWVGASFQGIYFDSSIVAMSSAYQGIFGQPEDRDLDILMHIDSLVPFTPSGNLGVRAAFLGDFSAGLSVQLPARIQDDEATINVRLPSHYLFDNAEIQGDTVSAGFDLPAVVRLGVRYEQLWGNIELDMTWEGWSTHDRIETAPRNLVITGVPSVDELVVGPLTVEMDWHDTLSFALGGDFIAIPDELTVRAGFIYEQAAIPDERLSLFQLDLEKYAPTLGLTWAIPNSAVLLDVAYAHFFFPSRLITNSEVRQINPTFEEGTVIVGNGYYEGNIDIFGVSVEVLLEDLEL
jgi:long-subunit fatty acid transport protein